MIMRLFPFFNILFVSLEILIGIYTFNFVSSLFLVLVIFKTELRRVNWISFTKRIVMFWVFAWIFDYSTVINGCFHESCFCFARGSSGDVYVFASTVILNGPPIKTLFIKTKK